METENENDLIEVGGMPCVPRTMAPHVRKVLAGEYALPPTVDLGTVETVLDLGANVGAFSVWALREWPGVSITAVEPVPENVAAYGKNLSSRRLGPNQSLHLIRAAVVPLAAVLPEESGLFYPGDSNCGEGSLYLREEQSDQPITVPWIGIDDLSLPVDVLKLDIEGAEVEVLRILPLEQVRKAVLLEWHGLAARDAVAARLKGAGFVLARESIGNEYRGVMAWARPEYVTAPRLAQAPKVFVGLPVYGGYHAHFVPCLLRLQGQAPCSLVIRSFPGDSLVSRARNRLAREFLATDCTHLLFLDTDLIFSPEHIARLLGHGEPVVAGLYPKKQLELGWVCNVLDAEDGGPGDPDDRGLHAVKYVGTGCLLIAREVFEALIEAHPELRYDADDGETPGDYWDFFRVGVWECPRTGRRRYLSEDWWFCQMARDLGYTIWADTRVVLKHCGEMVYPVGDLND